jgi:Cytochrome c7 and related cytochrome c
MVRTRKVARRPRRATLATSLAGLTLLAAVASGCRAFGDAAPPANTIFTPAHETFGAAVNDFFGIRPAVTQPFPFPHKTHVANKVGCTEYCHESVTKGPVAGLPSLKTCMICHESIATDRPLIQQITALSKSGIDLSWQRVYGYPAESHVRFNHAPHLRAKVDCANCHGSIDQQTVAQRNVDLKMGFCVNCHKSKQAPNECITCHF